MKRYSILGLAFIVAAGLPIVQGGVLGQGVALWTAEKPGSDNIQVLGHIPLGPRLSVADMDMEARTLAAVRLRGPYGVRRRG